ncbi:asparagine--tRNA ligase, mitochondrial [Trichomonascus vanleenenianus]|uniref:asparagine--tRNA ligase SLM5 n=1 Tax=Trichomonascus vanleenenianus TaxID=2268995 RepID=UPI003EC9B045
MRASQALLNTIRSIVASPRLGETASVNGWVRSVRRLKNVAFADLADGTSSSSLMVVMPPELSKELSTGACVNITGTLKQSPGANQHVELEASAASDIRVIGPASSEYPLQKKYHTPEFLRTIPQFRWKTQGFSAVLRYRSYALSRISSFFEGAEFTQVNSPLFTSSDCEGAGETFCVSSPNNPEFFGPKRANLTVSSQLHLEVYAAALSRVWNFTPAFRAEESDTNRHLSEFWMVEAEIAFPENGLESVMSNAENMIRSAVPKGKAADDLLNSIRQKDKKELVESRWQALSGEAWPRITYTEAIEILEKSAAKSKLRRLSWGDSLGSEHEKFLAGEYFKSPVFVTHYPTEQKPFYMQKSSDGKTVACFDLLVPGIGELIGGSMREGDYASLMAAMEATGMNVEDLSWYTDLRKYGSFPHGGYGLGFERLVCYVCGVENIRDAIGFPRHVGSCVC